MRLRKATLVQQAEEGRQSEASLVVQIVRIRVTFCGEDWMSISDWMDDPDTDIIEKGHASPGPDLHTKSLPLYRCTHQEWLLPFNAHET